MTLKITRETLLNGTVRARILEYAAQHPSWLSHRGGDGGAARGNSRPARCRAGFMGVRLWVADLEPGLPLCREAAGAAARLAPALLPETVHGRVRRRRRA